MNQNMKDIKRLKEQADVNAEKLSACLDSSKHVAFICCSYDTSFEPVETQILKKVDRLVEIYGLEGKVRWSLWVVDDLPDEEGFGQSVRRGFNAASERHGCKSRLNLLKMKSAHPVTGGLKGRALLDGMAAVLENDPCLSAIVYINLNLKVDAVFSAIGLSQVLLKGVDAAIGSRASGEGGLALGRGWAGNFKSRVFNFLVRKLLSLIKCYHDTNAPMKIYKPEAAALLVRYGAIPTVSMDCDWLMLLHLNGYKTAAFPVVWEQRPGSRPPWHMILPCFMDVLKIRKSWKQGMLSF